MTPVQTWHFYKGVCRCGHNWIRHVWDDTIDSCRVGARDGERQCPCTAFVRTNHIGIGPA